MRSVRVVGLDVDVAGVPPDGLGEERVDEAHDRRLLGGGVGSTVGSAGSTRSPQAEPGQGVGQLRRARRRADRWLRCTAVGRGDGDPHVEAAEELQLAHGRGIGGIGHRDRQLRALQGDRDEHVPPGQRVRHGRRARRPGRRPCAGRRAEAVLCGARARGGRRTSEQTGTAARRSRGAARAGASCSASSTPRRRRRSPSREDMMRAGRARGRYGLSVVEATRDPHHGGPTPSRRAARGGPSTTRTRARPGGAAWRRRPSVGRPARAAAARNGVRRVDQVDEEASPGRRAGAHGEPRPARPTGVVLTTMAAFSSGRPRAAMSSDIVRTAGAAGRDAATPRAPRRVPASGSRPRSRAQPRRDQAGAPRRVRCLRRRSARPARLRAVRGRAASARSRARRCCRPRSARHGTRACSPRRSGAPRGSARRASGSTVSLSGHGEIEAATPRRRASRSASGSSAGLTRQRR